MPVHIKKIHHTKTIYKIVEKPVYVQESGLQLHPLQSLRVADGGGAKSDGAVHGGNRNSSVENIFHESDGNKTKPRETLENGNGRDAMTGVENRPLATSPENSPIATGVFLNGYFGSGYGKDVETVNIVRDGKSSIYKRPFRADDTGSDHSHTSVSHDEHIADDAAFRGNRFKHATTLYGNPKPRKFGDINQNDRENHRIFVHGPNTKKYPDVTLRGNDNGFPTSRRPAARRPPHSYSAFSGSSAAGQDQRDGRGAAVRSPNTYTRFRGQSVHGSFHVFGENITGRNGHSAFPGPVASVHECKELHAIRGLAVHNELSKPTGVRGKGQYQVQENAVDFDDDPISNASPPGGPNSFGSSTADQPAGGVRESANPVNKLSSTQTNAALPPVIVKNVYYTLDPVVPYNDVA